MVNDPLATVPEPLRAVAAQRGLARALALAPAAARAAIERAAQGIPTPAAGSVTEPAGTFDPAAHAGSP
jgi:hypothetical protein